MSDLGFWNLAQSDPDAPALIDPNEVIFSRGQLLQRPTKWSMAYAHWGSKLVTLLH